MLSRMNRNWISKLKEAEKTAMSREGKKLIHYKFSDGKEMAEEYNEALGVLIKRVWKMRSNVFQMNEWEVEVGEMDSTSKNVMDGFKESTPNILHRHTKTNLTWRINPLPWDASMYVVEVDVMEKCIIVKTKNKKYYKKLQLIDLQRLGIPVKKSALTFHHKSNVLLINYEKPEELLKHENEVKLLLKFVPTMEDDDGNLECSPS